MKVFSLNGALRNDLGKKATRAFRKEGIIPAVIYGGENKKSALHISVKAGDVRNLIYTPEIFLIELSVEGVSYKAILKELQFHPVTDEILHIDFLQVFDDKPIEMDVPVVLNGLADGVKAGGKLSLDMRKLKVKALYKDVPEKLHIDVTELSLGKTIQVGNLHFEGLEVLNAKNAVVCRVQMTRAVKDTDTTATTTAVKTEEA